MNFAIAINSYLNVFYISLKIRDIKWNPFIEDVFAMVSDNGSLCVFDIRLNRPMLKTTSAHAGEATSVDWHPSDKYVLATGGGRDRLVKGQ